MESFLTEQMPHTTHNRKNMASQHPPHNKGTLARQITVPLIGLVVLFSILAIGLTYLYLSHSSQAALEAKAEEFVIILNESLEVPIWKLDTSTIKKIGNVIGHNEQVAYLKISDTKGDTLFEYGDPTSHGFIRKSFSIFHKKLEIAQVDLYLSSVLQKRENTNVIMSSIFLVLVVALGLMISTKLLLEKMLQSPLDYLLRRIGYISSGDYREESKDFPQKEFAVIVEKFDDMARKIQLRENSLTEMNKELERQFNEIKIAEKQKADLEVKLRQAYKMEAIGTLAGGIAHDFNNLLGAILGYSEMARDDAPQGSSIARDLDKVLIASHRAKELVKQILTFSRQSQVDLIPIAIQPIIKESLKMLRSSIPTTIEIRDDIDSECGNVLADPTQIHQILMNLCTNAYHAMEEKGGTLSIALKSASIESVAELKTSHGNSGEYIELVVADTGSGIGPDVINKIFDPYFTTKEVGRGTGMGLAIIHGIVNEYGGDIKVESILGKGTTFHVFFPVSDGDVKEAEEMSETIPQGEGHILFVDDEDILAEMGKEMLERLGYDVTVKMSSLEALEVFQNSPDSFDVIITDQTMPGMTGSDLARRILQIRPHMPIILCTGYSTLIDEKSAKFIGIREFANKPLSKITIAQLLRKVLAP
nr:response regulator [Desulfobulbaceae bacterium]